MTTGRPRPDWWTEACEQHLQRFLDAAPPLTDEQKRTLRELLTPAPRQHTHGDAA